MVSLRSGELQAVATIASSTSSEAASGHSRTIEG